MVQWSRLCPARWSDAWEERLAGESGLVITSFPNRRTVRLEIWNLTRKAARRLQEQFGGTIRKVQTRNWAALGSQPPPPVKIRDRLLVTAETGTRKLGALQRAHPARLLVSVPMDMAFGTGHHPTTATMLRLLVDFAKARQGRPWTLCDLGTGSGVLAIAAAKLGARQVRASDIDPAAVRVARRNVLRNRVPLVRLEKSDVRHWVPRERYDAVAANLFSSVLVEAFPRIARALRPGGMAFVSGMLKSQARECLQAGKRAGLQFNVVVAKGKWVSAAGVRVGRNRSSPSVRFP